MDILNLDRSAVAALDLRPTVEEKVILIACRHYLRATAEDEVTFVRMLLDLASQAQDEFKEILSGLMESPPALVPLAPALKAAL